MGWSATKGSKKHTSAAFVQSELNEVGNVADILGSLFRIGWVHVLV